jgi:hypothetical protein
MVNWAAEHAYLYAAVTKEISMTYEPDDSAERVSRYRRHAVDDHSLCLYQNCKPRQELEYANDERLLAVALFEALAERSINAKAWFGDGYGTARELADAESPDYLPREPDSLIRLRAKRAVNL